MIIVSRIADVLLADPMATLAVLRAQLLALAETDALILSRVPMPRVYGAPVVWRPEPHAGEYEELADCLTVLQRGWGDCDDLVPWRVAELWVTGEDPGARVKVYARTDSTRHLYHTEVRRSDGTTEDVSRYLGMGAQEMTA